MPAYEQLLLPIDDQDQPPECPRLTGLRQSRLRCYSTDDEIGLAPRRRNHRCIRRHGTGADDTSVPLIKLIL